MSVTSSFTNQKPFVATADDCNAHWACKPLGERFRCGLCGYRFKAGDIVRWQYTNDIPGAGGNPLVCAKCDGPDVVERWKKHCEEWASIQDKFWHFRNR